MKFEKIFSILIIIEIIILISISILGSLYNNSGVKVNGKHINVVCRRSKL